MFYTVLVLQVHILHNLHSLHSPGTTSPCSTRSMFYTVHLFTSLHFRKPCFAHTSLAHSPRLIGLFHKLMFYILTFTSPPLILYGCILLSLFYTVDVLRPYYVLQGQRLTIRRFAQAFYAAHGLPSIFSTSTVYKVHVLF